MRLPSCLQAMVPACANRNVPPPSSGPRRGLLGEREHAIPVAPLLPVRLAQVEEGAVVVRIELQRFLEEVRADVDVLVAQDPSRPERERQARSLLAVARLREDLLLRALELIEATLLAEDALVHRGDLSAPGIGGVSARQHRLGLVGRVAARDARRAQEDASLALRVLRVVRRAQQRGDVLLPRSGFHLHVGEARACLGALASARAQAARIRRRGLLPITKVAEHVAELEEQLTGARPVRAGLELQLEELLHHVELAEIPVHAPGGLEALDERGIEFVRVLEVLERLHAREKLALEGAPEAQVVLGLRRVARGRRDSFLELLDQALPVADVLQIRNSLL